MSVNYASSQQQQQRSRGPGARKPITNAINNGGGLIRLTITGHGYSGSTKVDVTGVIGTTEANGIGWAITVVDANTIDLTGSSFSHAYVSGGLAHAQ